MSKQKITPVKIIEAKSEGRKLVMITTYDYPFGLIAEEAGVDMALVGDSLGMVVLGLPSTLEVTMDMMVHHARAVSRGCKTPLIIGDMPFMSYHASVAEAVRNAGRMIREGRCNAVKLEGGAYFAPTVEAIAKAGIPVQGHVGLLPQSAGASGAFKTQGRDAAGALQIIEDAKAIEAAGAFSIVIEAVPAPLGKLVAESVQIPVIGIGAGPDVDGQVLVTHDMVGLFDRFVPKFVKQYANIRPIILEAVSRYAEEVRSGHFPSEAHSFTMPQAVVDQLQQTIEQIRGEQI
jgi:3-methyl-2-oxobutanoate hydroxymethyltransferase